MKWVIGVKIHGTAFLFSVALRLGLVILGPSWVVKADFRFFAPSVYGCLHMLVLPAC